MWDHVETLAKIFGVFIALLVFFFAIYKYNSSEKKAAKREGKVEGEEDGSLKSKVCSHQKWLVGLEERMQSVEADYLSEEDHKTESDACVRRLESRRAEDRERITAFETLLHDTREMVVEVRTMVKGLVKSR